MAAFVVGVAPLKTVPGEVEVLKCRAGLSERKKRGSYVVNKAGQGPRIRAAGAAWAIGLGVLLFIIDSLANAMPNTAYTIMAATLVSIYPLVSPKAMKRLQAPPRIQVEEPDADEPPEPVPNASPAQG